MNESEKLLEVKKISKTYYSKKGLSAKVALSNASFDLYQAEVLGLLGVNGAGKTTLSSIIATMYPPSSGDILWKGISIYKQLLNYRQVIGICPQKPNIEKRLNIEENLLFAARCYGLSQQEAVNRKDILMERFDLTSYAQASCDQLSGGYRQRFLILRALMHNPKLLILDEPTVGLDPHIRRQIWDIVKMLKSLSVTVILTTHYLDEAEYLSDRVCLIHSGEIKTIDTPNNLKTFHKKNNLEEVFLKFVDDPDAALFNSYNALT